MILYYQDKKKPVFGPFLAKKAGFCRPFSSFFAKQSEGFLVFFSADFLRLAAAMFSVCRYKGFTAEHLLRQMGKKRSEGILSVWGYVKGDGCRPGSAQPCLAPSGESRFV